MTRKSPPRLPVAAVVLFALLGVGFLFYQWDNSTPETAPQAGDNRPAVEGRVRVEVVNGGGVAGVARDATETLRRAGFDVVWLGNASDFEQETSEVVDRIGNPNPAESVAAVLGIPSVRSEPDTNLYLDVSVILGSEWQLPAGGEETASAERAWWDVRGWFQG